MPRFPLFPRWCEKKALAAAANIEHIAPFTSGNKKEENSSGYLSLNLFRSVWELVLKNWQRVSFALSILLTNLTFSVWTKEWRQPYTGADKVVQLRKNKITSQLYDSQYAQMGQIWCWTFWLMLGRSAKKNKKDTHWSGITAIFLQFSIF